MKRFIAALSGLMLLLSAPANAQRFSVSLPDGNKLFFRITDESAKQVEVVQAGAMLNTPLALPTGTLEIPSSVKYKDVSYQVSAIHEGAFSRAEELTLVHIPSSVKEIGDNAFSGCSKLEGVIFPASEPTLGKGVFAGCKSLRHISFGSDWRKVDFAIFADSEVLTSVFIPAQVVDVKNLKLVKMIERIDVDPNNPAFSSIDGALYSKDGKAFYACPCAQTGRFVVASGAERIQEGAFNGCEGLESIVLPETVHAFSFLDFASCTSLKELTVLSEIPPVTAKWNGSPVFAIRKPVPEFRVYVPAASMDRYQSGICDKAGDYESMNGKKRDSFTEDDMVSKKDIQKAKSR